MQEPSDQDSCEETVPKSMEELAESADDNCKYCYGRGYTAICITPGLRQSFGPFGPQIVGDHKGKPDIVVCRCVIKKFKS